MVIKLQMQSKLACQTILVRMLDPVGLNGHALYCMDTSNPYFWLLADVCTSVVCQLHDFTNLLQKFQAYFGVFALSWP